MLLDIVTYPDAVLATPTEPITEVTPELRQLADDMAETMYAAPGVGLAANQVGRSLRLFTADDGKGLLVVLNPVIVHREGQLDEEEGCLSVPGPRAPVRRASRVVLEGMGLDGQPLRLTGEGLLARIFQHEVDHLDGQVFLDRLSALKRKLLEKRIKR